ncbi:DUF3817 domain-containing protein [Dermabacteraceae bacterium P13101]|nr:DUF3817 domain-containing protein [Dermabacteraceae bacterium TAE3-ERU5]
MQRPLDEVQIRTALARFKVASIVEGIALLVLVAIMVMRYVVYPTPGPDHATWSFVSAKWSPVHGLIYIIYVILAFDLWLKMRWHIGRMLLLMFFGVVPVLSFFGEHWTHQHVERELRERVTTDDIDEADLDAYDE